MHITLHAKFTIPSANVLKCNLGLQRSAKLPQQVALTALRSQARANVWVVLVINSACCKPGYSHVCWKALHLSSTLSVEQFTNITTPKRSTYEHKKHQCLHLRWSEYDYKGTSSFEIRRICHIQPPQQVALTECNSQVNAQVGPIRQTWPGKSSFLASFSVLLMFLSSLFYVVSQLGWKCCSLHSPSHLKY